MDILIKSMRINLQISIFNIFQTRMLEMLIFNTPVEDLNAAR